MMAQAAEQDRRSRLAQRMRDRGWHYKTPGDGIRHRAYDLVSERYPWYDWGHRLMVLTGSDSGGNWQEPTPPTWWYRLGPPKRMVRTHYPRHPLSTFEVVKDYDEFQGRTKGLNEDRMYEWQAMAVDSDHELVLGHRYWGGNFYGMRKDDTALLRRYLRMWRRHDWFGLRSWLYSQGLHAAVNRKVPFTCQAVPPKGAGGYDHWYCDQKRKHEGLHRSRNYQWEQDGDRVEHKPEVAEAYPGLHPDAHPGEQLGFGFAHG